MDIEKAKKVTFAVNTIILILVFGLMGFFYICHATFLVYFSIPTACIYLIGYFLIYKEHLDFYVRMVYLWLTLYMCVTTLCLGYNFGFHLYCMSMIPVIFVTEYITYKLGRPKIGAVKVSIAIGIAYILCTGFVGYFHPIYDIHQKYSMLFWITNALTVFGFLIFYSSWMIKMVTESEEKLQQMAHIDKLTGLYNRHYMLEQLELSDSTKKDRFVAIADIDSFKHINDTYGHNAGDYVLLHLSEIMKETCKNCVVSRWGGEEFLLLYTGKGDDASDNSLGQATNNTLNNSSIKTIINVSDKTMNNPSAHTSSFILQMEQLRKTVEASEFIFEGAKINVTITIGLAEYAPDLSTDKWVQKADEGLYYGKTHGKNQVIKL